MAFHVEYKDGPLAGKIECLPGEIPTPHYKLPINTVNWRRKDCGNPDQYTLMSGYYFLTEKKNGMVWFAGYTDSFPSPKEFKAMNDLRKEVEDKKYKEPVMSARADKSKLFELVKNLMACGFRGSTQMIVDQHIRDYWDLVGGDGE